MVESLIVKLGAIRTSHASDFAFFVARQVAEVVRGLAIATEGEQRDLASPLHKSILFNRCQKLAEMPAGDVAFSFTVTDLYDGPLNSARSSLQLLAPLQPRPRSPERTKTRRKFNGIFQQGGEGGDDEFDVMNEFDHAKRLRAFEVNVFGGEIPRAEQPTPAQMSAVKTKLEKDKSPSPDLDVYGPFGDRTQRAMAGVGDIEIDGVRTRRKFRGHNSLIEWRPRWEVFKYTMLVLQACTTGPLDDYLKNMDTLDAEFPDRWGILALADETNRREAWPRYRAVIERMAAAGFSPDFYNPMMPWAAVISMAAADAKSWEKHFVKPCERNIRAADAAAAAAQAKPGHLPAMLNDGFREMQMGINAGGVPGP